jgi:ATP-dependent DNA helicase RecG
VPFDDRFNPQAKIEDLSKELMIQYLKRVGSELEDEAPNLSFQELGQQMGVVGGPQEAPLPLNVGLMMFNAEPHRFFPGTQIDVVWFPKEGPGGDKFSEKVFQGPLPEMIGDTLDYIRRSFISETVIKHPDRAEATRVKNVPYEAIEEALVNAVYHRNYEDREPVEVRIMHDEVVVLSYPGPDRSVSLDQLKAGKAMPRRYRNRRIGEFLKELEFTEGRGTGIPKILKAMRDNGSPEPEFEFDENHSFFMVKLPVHPAALEVVGNVEDIGEATGSPTQSTDPVGRLLKQLESGEKSSGELRKALGLRHRPTFRENYLHPAQAQELVELTIPEKPSSRLQKYRITDKGRKYLEN